MKRGLLNNKEGAIELSITTIIIVVIGVTLLILGLVLVKNIFGGATKATDVLNEKTINTMAQLFGDETSDVIVKLGSDKTVSVSPDSKTNVVVLARTLDGTPATQSRLKATFSLDPANGNNCISPSILGEVRTKKLFVTPLNQPQPFDQASGAVAGISFEISVPKGTPICSQKVRVVVTDTSTNSEVGFDSFILRVEKGGWF